MKIKRTVLSFLIIAIIAQTLCFSAGAKTAGSVVGAEEAYGLLQYTGIMPGDTEYETVKNSSVSRGSFALYLSRIISRGKSGTDVYFSDIDSSTETGSAVNFLASAGILNGYGDGTFRPDNLVTVKEMMFAAMRLLGYKTEQWQEAEYFKYAERIDLLDGIDNYSSASMSDCIVLLYNVLHAQTVEYAVWNDNYKKEIGDTVLETYFDIEFKNVQITGNSYVAIDGEKTENENFVTADGVLYKTEVPEIAEWIGYNTVIYFKDTGSVKTIVYYLTDKSNDNLVIYSDEFGEYNYNYIEYSEKDSNKSKRVSLASDAAIIKNSKLVTTNYKNAFDIDYGKITLIPVNGKYKIIIIEAFENYTVTEVDISRKILYTDKKDKNNEIISVCIDKSKQDYVMIRNLPYGKEVNENTIEPDDLVSLCISDDGKIVKGYLCSEKVSGTIESVSKTNDITVTIDGAEYKVDPYVYEQQSLAAGIEGDFTLDFSGRIAAYSISGSRKSKIGYIYAMDRDDFKDIARVKIFNTSRKHEILELNKYIRFNGESRTLDYVCNKLCSTSDSSLRRQVIEYEVNDAGNISSINLSVDSKEDRIRDNTLYTLLPKGSYYWYYQMKSYDSRYVLSKNTYYMRVPPESNKDPDETLFGCQPFSNVTWYNQNGSKSILGLYKFDDSTPYADLLLVQSNDSASLTNQTEITMVAYVGKSYSEEYGELTVVRGLRRAVEVTAYIEKDVYKNDIEVGDLIRFAVDVRGYVGDYEVVYDENGGENEEGKVMWNITSTANEYTSNTNSVGGLRYTFGYVNSLYIAPYSSGLNSVIETGQTPGTTDDIWQVPSNTTNQTRFIVYDKDRREDKVYMAHLDEITSYESCGDISQTSRVFVHCRSGWLIAVLIYK